MIFQDNIHPCIIQELSYDVRKEDVQKLLLSGIIQVKII